MSNSSNSRFRSRPLHKLKSQIISDLTSALAHASRRLSLRAAGQSDFAEPDDLKHTLSLLKLLPQLLPLLPDAPAKPDPSSPHYVSPLVPRWFNLFDDDHRDLVRKCFIPPCPICNAAPGHHWVISCPQKSPDHDLTHLISLQSFWARQTNCTENEEKLLAQTSPSKLPPDRIREIFKKLKADYAQWKASQSNDKSQRNT